MFLMVCTRPDIAFAVGQMAQFSHDPRKVHMAAVQRIFGYLKGTLKFGFTYHPNSCPNSLTAFTDSDYAGDTDTRRSTTGSLLLYNGAPIAWGSRRLLFVSLSTTESEYNAISETTKDVVWVRRLLNSIGCKQPQPTKMFCDNQGAVKLSSNPEFHRRTKHIDVRYHYVREQQQLGCISVIHVGTKDQLADILTKALPGPTFQDLRKRIGVEPFSI